MSGFPVELCMECGDDYHTPKSRDKLRKEFIATGKYDMMGKYQLKAHEDGITICKQCMKELCIESIKNYETWQKEMRKNV